MKVMNQMIAIVSVIGLCAAVACDRRSPVSPDAAASSGRSAECRRCIFESSNASARAQPSVFTAACDINAALTDFQTALGPLNPNVVGEQNGGRREVNWDAVPPAFTNTSTFPGDFFNQNFSPRARGVVFSTDGSGLSVSDNDFSVHQPCIRRRVQRVQPGQDIQRDRERRNAEWICSSRVPKRRRARQASESSFRTWTNWGQRLSSCSA